MTGLVQLPDGARGFDANEPLDLESARAWYAKGFRFVLRYVPRRGLGPLDLTMQELGALLDAGLAVMPVQHVEREGWTPTVLKGGAYGRAAAVGAMDAGLPRGVTLWCDLEGVAPDTPAQTIVDYCQEWHLAVKRIGYRPGLYVGYGCGLTPEQLYRSLSFDAYWRAYNLNDDQTPAERGVCMRQHELPNSGRPAGFEDHDGIDEDVVHADALGGLPFAYAPAGWTA